MYHFRLWLVSNSILADFENFGEAKLLIQIRLPFSLDTGKVFPPNNFSFLVSTGHVIREKHSSQRAHYKDLCGNSPRVFLKLGEFQTLAFNLKKNVMSILHFH